MSLNYAESLSPYANKGKCGLPEKEESLESIEKKCEEFFDLINRSKNIVVLTGAGISTSCGIPDFRGPNGVWTLEKQGKKPNVNVSFEDSKPSFSHFALVQLNKLGKLEFLISQNIDGLHMKSGFPLNKLAELHGNMFIEKCNVCNTKYINNKCVNTIGLKPTGKKCNKVKNKGTCRGELHDTILDWDDSLPAEDMLKSELNCKNADLCICLGTTLQIMPVGSYPLLSKKHNQNGKIVIVNLQPTRLDNRADLIINAKIDVIFQILFDKHFKLKIEIDEYYLSQENNQVDTKNKLTLNYSYVYTYIKKEEEKAINLEDNKQKMIKNEPNQPDLVLILNGKRKSGKDYVYKKLIEHLQNQKPDVFNFTIITLSAPLKQMYAQENGLNYERLLDSSDYKETYRLDMIKWSDSKREQNPFIFCQKAIEQPLEQVCLNDKSNQLNVWIVSDARRKTDLNFFSENFPSQIKTVQIHAEDSIRQERNWIFTEGVDDSISECDLDSIKNWNFKICNNNDETLHNSLQILIDYIKQLAETNKHY